MKIFFLLAFFCFGILYVDAQTLNSKQYKYIFKVAKDGSGDYSTIQEAINAMRVYPLAPITLYIKKGIYKEKIELPINNTDVTFIGDNVDSTIITYDDYSGKGAINTFNSYTAKISGNRFRAENITFINSSGPIAQAVTLCVDADKVVFFNCKFIGNQDTIFNGGETSRQLFDNCYIEGTTDFIFGPATAVYQNCTIKAKANSYITAASTTKGKKFGLVFINCKIESSPYNQKIYLGRPWRSYAKTIFIKTLMPSSIHPAGWHNWDNPENEKTVFYAEYENYGPGANTKYRSKWATQLLSKQAAKYTLENIFDNRSIEFESEKKWYKKKLLFN